MGADTRDFRAMTYALSISGVHKNSFLVLNRGRRGANRVAMAEVLEESWFTKPTKDRRSDRLAGTGNLEMASVIVSLTSRQNEPCEVNLRHCIQPLVHIQRDVLLRTSLKELTYVTHVLFFIAVVDYDVVHDAAITGEARERFVHASIVMFGYRRDAVRCSQEFEPAIWGYKRGQPSSRGHW